MAKLVAKIETKGAKKSASELEQFSDSAKKADKSTDKLGKTLKKAPKVLAALATAAAAVSAAVTALAIKSANAQRELQALANVAGESAEDFRALAFATNTVGISAEKLSDISKDVKEKLGEFIATGGGGFKDFFEQVAPLVNLTAKELQDLSGPQVLQRVKNAMDEANISINEQSFLLESIASDTTLLIPLLAKEGEQLENLTKRFKEATDAISITANESQGLQELATTFSLLGEQSSVAASSISAALAPTLDALFKNVITVVPQATQALVDFMNTFISAENLSSIPAIEAQIVSVTESLESLKKQAKIDEDSFFGRSFLSDELIKKETERLDGLNARLVELTENEKKLADAKTKFKKGETVDVKAGEQLKQLRAQSESFLAETDRIGRTRLELIQIQETERLDQLREFANIGLIEFTDFEAAKTRILQDSTDQRTAIADQERSTMLANNEQLFGTLSDLAGQFAGEQSDIFKALFVTQKAFALASSINNIALAQSQAAADPTAVTTAQKLANVALIASQLVGIANTIQGNDYSARAQGGQFRAGQDLLVGEKGPELVRPLFSGRIADAGTTAGLMNSAPTVTIINQTTGRIDEVETSRDDRGDMIIIAREVINRDIQDPNSDFNKNLDRTRKIQRSF